MKSNSKTKEELEYEERVKKRVLILKDLIEQDKIHFAQGMKSQLEESFSKARFDKNGEPDLNTIDGTVRSLALVAEQFDRRNKIRSSISLYEIQRSYFDALTRNFAEFYNMMVKNHSTPHRTASYIAYSGRNIDFLNDPIEQLLDDFEDFWKIMAEPGYLHLEDDDDSIKAVFGGDLFPSNEENIASKCGLYTDTIVLPCPFIRSRHMFAKWNKQQRVYYLLKHALNVLQYRELALVELDKPIVVVLADKEMIDDFSFQETQRLGKEDALFHATKVFDRNFKSIEELIDFGKSLDSVSKVLHEVKDKRKVLFDTAFKESLEIQLENQMNGQSAQLLGTNHPGLIVSMLGLGRMSVCNELLLKSTKVGGVPLIDAPTSWEYFKWKIQYDSERANPNTDLSKLHVVKGLNGLSGTNLSWIGKIPPKGLIEIRKDGAINEIRQILTNGIEDLVRANQSDFARTSDKVFINLNEAFNKHQENIKELVKKKWKIAGKDIGSWLVMGTAEIASACVGTPLYGASAFAIDQILDPPKIKDLPLTIQKLKDIENQKRTLKKSAVGLMFNYKNK